MRNLGFYGFVIGVGMSTAIAAFGILDPNSRELYTGLDYGSISTYALHSTMPFLLAGVGYLIDRENIQR